MKKIFLVLGILSTFAFTDVTNTLPREMSTPVDNENKVFCTISCSTTVDGVTYTTTAGNWFTSCQKATSKCSKKLLRIAYE